MLCVINGDGGGKKGGKIIKSVFDALISCEVAHHFTWSGKSTPGQKKIAFSTYKEIVGIIYAVVRRADPGYCRKDCEKDLTYKVLKHAHARYTGNSNTEPSKHNTESHIPDESKQLLDLLLPLISRANNKN